MKNWPQDELQRVAGTDDLHISPSREVSSCVYSQRSSWWEQKVGRIYWLLSLPDLQARAFNTIEECVVATGAEIGAEQGYSQNSVMLSCFGLHSERPLYRH
jgi:hypothetical protein